MIIGEGSMCQAFRVWIDEHTLIASNPGSGLAVAVKKWQNFLKHQDWLMNMDKRLGGQYPRDEAYEVVKLALNGVSCQAPSTWPASETLKMKPDGVFLSNGPGDPSAVPYAVETVKEIIGKLPFLASV
ncbi:hypothetical protein SASPL_116405 [Salvia splendens]|uniref:Glutamine amidotransferase domain-containing protein n=1 Tax=Salvia splendens TaxID=180675 RepID=A0A8X8ZWU2_SALSN|nr:hypothetical protein SASPL_116405 [Salvia splendens]